MALSQSIVWTTLPHGRIKLPDGKSALRFSVFVSPRLTPTADQILKPFDVFRDWPKYAAALKLNVVFDGGPTGELIPWPGEDPLDSDLWGRFFDANTFVRGHSFTDLKDVPIRSFPVDDVLSYVQGLYGATAEKFGGDFPGHGPNDDTPLGKLKGELGPLSDGAVRSRFDKMLGTLLEDGKVLKEKPSGLGTPAQVAFFQATRFYDRKKKPGSNLYSERPDPSIAVVPVKLPEFDFHQAITAFADYPRLMRRLGLVLDYVWTGTAAIPTTGRVRVEVQWGDSLLPPAWHTKDLPAWTAYALGSETFRARATAGVDAELTRGLLDLRLATDAAPQEQKSPYLIAQLDVDGSALKVTHTAGSLVRLDDPDTTNYRSPRHSDLPALRTSGLSVYKRNRAIATHAQLLRASAIQTSFANKVRADYTADDLLRGYRIDVWDDVSKDWHPLCLRNGDYFLSKKGKLQLTLRDEGYVKGSSASRGDVAVEDHLYLHERIASFEGWSLVASRPGKTLDADPTTPDPVAPPENAATEFGLATHFAPPAGTVPRLRFGRSYKLRVRLVDIAGNSVEFRDAGDVYASPSFSFTRYEPVPSPTLLLRARVTEGESHEHLVIRSDYDRTAASYAADPAVEAALEAVRTRLKLKPEVRASYAYLDKNERHVAPPKTSQLEAERHGCFDEFMSPGKDHAKGYRLAARESGSFLSKKMVNLATGAEEPIQNLDIEVVPSMGTIPTNLDNPNRKPGDPLKQGEYVLHKEAQLIVPYLPDPFAAGVALTGLPGWPADEPFIVWFKGTWPEVEPFRIRLVERPGTLNQCAQNFSTTGEPKMDPVENVLTIYQAKGVVSAVRYSSLLPKDEAQAKKMGIWKWLEQRGGLNATTRKLIMNGRHWMFTPWRTMMLVHAVQHPLCPPTITLWDSTRSIGDTFADFRGHWYLSVKSTDKIGVQANWTEPVDDVAKPTWQVIERSANVTEVKIPTTASDEYDVGAVGGIFGVSQSLRHEFGDTKHRVIRYRLKGTTRFREYFPVEITNHDSAITRTGADFEVIVRSSARPSSTTPLYVIPTFRWVETDLPNNGVSRTRKGNGLRVYLERPWWSSGQSERLGVVFREGPVADGDKALVTQWGMDPAFRSSLPLPGPKLDSFPLKADYRSQCSLEEKGNAVDVYTVAGHAVQFDPDRKLWFSDIEVSAGASYFPFIRLAVARFQPYSIEDCHLSRVVQTDFIQLVPDRTVRLTWVSPTKVRIQIYGPAPTGTYVSRLLQPLTLANTDAQVRTAKAPIVDIAGSAPTGAKAVEFFQVNQLEFIQREAFGAVDKVPGLTTVPPDPQSPSSGLGLNEYIVSVEQLPPGESPEFGWVAIDGIIPTKPPATSSGSAIKIDPKEVKAAVLPRTTTAPTAKTSTAATKLGAVTKLDTTPTTKGIGAIGTDLPPIELDENSPFPTMKPLWEGDLTLPASSANRPRRVVVREHELYFKATPQDGDGFIPLARRLVYADMITLPGPTS